MSAPPNEVLDLVTRLKSALDERQALQARRRTIITDWHERKVKVEQAEWNALCQNLS